MLEETYSIALRLRRITVEDAYVSIRVTQDILKEDADGSLVIDFEKFAAKAVQLGGNSLVEWQVESSVIEPHPTQGPKPADRQLVDSAAIN